MQSAVLVANNGARQTAEAFVRARTMLLDRGVRLTRTHGQLAKSKSVLGVLPLGTGNTFALSLGITDLDVAVDAIAGGREVAVDLGHVKRHLLRELRHDRVVVDHRARDAEPAEEDPRRRSVRAGRDVAGAPLGAVSGSSSGRRRRRSRSCRARCA